MPGELGKSSEAEPLNEGKTITYDKTPGGNEHKDVVDGNPLTRRRHRALPNLRSG